MAPSAVDSAGRMLNGFGDHKIDTMNPHDLVQFDKSLTPKKYEIKGTKPDSKILFTDVNIIDSTGADAFRGDVYIEGASQVLAICASNFLQVSGSSTSGLCRERTLWSKTQRYGQSRAGDELL